MKKGGIENPALMFGLGDGVSDRPTGNRQLQPVVMLQIKSTPNLLQ
jgi:hypothetical protein